MSNITEYTTKAGRRYRVRYRKPDGTQTDKRGFKTKRAAQEWAARNTAAIRDGSYIDPSAGKTTVGDLHATWITLKAGLKPSYLASLESTWNTHVNPTWGARAVSSIRKSELQAWISELATRRSPTITRRAHDILAGILDLAVNDQLIRVNPARGFPLPRKTRGRHAYLTWEQLVAFAAECGRYEPFVLFLATTGLRWGEAIALQGKHVDRARGRVTVERSASYVKGSFEIGTPKTHELRSVPAPPSVFAMVPRALPDVLVWQGPTGGMIRRQQLSKGWWGAAVKACQNKDPHFPEITPHDLRHTAASLAVSAGANVKAVQRMLGHASAAMTLDQYADLFDTDLDAVALALDDHLRKLVS